MKLQTETGGEAAGARRRRMYQLPRELEREGSHFVELLLETRAGKRRRRLRQDWASALVSYRAHYTSLQHQRQALNQLGD